MPGGKRPSGGPVRHANPTYRFTEYPNVPYTGEVPVDPDPEWPLETHAWWKALVAMPHCAGWGPTDWNYAKDTGHIHAQWTLTRKNSWLPELRYREAKMGTTADARLSTRIRWVDMDETTTGGDATVSPIRRLG